MRSHRKFQAQHLNEHGLKERGPATRQGLVHGRRVHHEENRSREVWGEKEEASWEACLEKMAAELRELCRGPPSQAWIRERCLETNCDREC